MYKDIKELMDIELKHLSYNKKLYEDIQGFRISWMQKSDDYIEFLGGNTLGVQPIRFSSRDEDIFCNDIIGVDVSHLRTEILKVKGLDPKWRTATNPMYQMLGYIIHRFTKSKEIGSHREDAIRETYLIMAYKVMGSLIANSFKFNTTPEIAQATYEKLSKRYLIKRLHTWQEVFEYRVNDLLPKGLHYTRVVNYTTDDSVRILNDLQGRLRELVKNIYRVMLTVITDDTKINSSSLVSGSEDGDKTGELTERADKYITYIRSIFENPNSLIDDDLLYLLGNIIPNLDMVNLKNVLRHMSENDRIKPGSKEDYISIAIVKTIAYNRTKGLVTDYRNNIIEMLKNVRGYWSSSSVKDKEVKDIKKYLFKHIRKISKRKTKWMIITTTIGVLLYIFLRAIAKK